jgi:alanyl-tRNA synthetase
MRRRSTRSPTSSGRSPPGGTPGSRNFDHAALIDSRHHLGGSIDRYRLGKSLRRKGFDHAGLLAGLDGYVARANETLAGWVASKAEVTLAGESDLFTAERVWRCGISPAATMPCGGTHVASLGEIESIVISMEFDEDAQELRLLDAALMPPARSPRM